MALDSDLLVPAILRVAREEDDPEVWLKAAHKAALEAVMAGDEFVSSQSFGGRSFSGNREVPAKDLLSLYELALQQFEYEEQLAAEGLEHPGSVRHADFSDYPCKL